MEVSAFSPLVHLPQPYTGWCMLPHTFHGTTQAICVSSQHEMYLINLEDASVIHMWNTKFDVVGDLQAVLQHTCRCIVARTSQGVLVYEFKAEPTLSVEPRHIKVAGLVATHCFGSSPPLIVAISQSGDCVLFGLNESTISVPLSGDTSFNYIDSEILGATLFVLGVVAGSLVLHKAALRLPRSLPHTFGLQPLVTVCEAESADSIAQAKVFVHEYLNAVSAVYPLATTKKRTCQFAWKRFDPEGHIKFSREVTMEVDETGSEGTGGRAKRVRRSGTHSHRSNVCKIGAAQLLFSTCGHSLVMSSWDVGYGAPLWSTQASTNTHISVGQVAVSDYDTSSALLLGWDSTRQSLLKSAIHAPRGVKLTSHRCTLRDVLGNMTNQPATKRHRSFEGSQSCTSPVQTSDAIQTLVDRIEASNKAANAPSEDAQSAHFQSMEELVDACTRILLQGEMLDDRMWEALSVCVSSGSIAVHRCRCLIATAESTGRADFLHTCLRHSPDLSEYDVVDILRVVMCILSDEFLECWTVRTVHKRGKLQNVISKMNRTENIHDDEKPREEGASHRLRMLRLFVCTALARPLNTSLLTDALRHLSSQETETLICLLSTYAKLLSLRATSAMTLVSPSDEASFQRVCRWLEALCDANYSPLVMHAHSNARLHHLLSELQTVCTESASQAQVCENTLGLCSFLSSARSTASISPRVHDDYQIEVMLLSG